MERDKDWLNLVSDKLRNAEMEPPQQGWERLEKALAQQPAVVATPRWRIYAMRTAAVAAVLALGLLLGDYLWQRDPALQQAADFQLAALPTAQSSDAPSAAAQSAAQKSEPDASLLALAKPLGHANRRSGLAVSEPKSVVATESAVESVSDVALLSISEQPENRTEEPHATPKKSQAATRSARTAYPEEIESASPKVRRKTGIGLFGAGSVTSSSETNPVFRKLSLDMANDQTPVVPKQPRDDYRESSFRHHQPLSFGISVRKELRYGLSVESGVNYTMLRSDVRKPFATDDMSQKLHYIGVPLRLNWQCYEQGRFSLYIGVGGMAEKCLSAKLGTQSIDEKSWQWSLNGAIGAQYRLGGLVGLYFEPEASYYLTETTLRTARTETPLSLTLRLGVRLSF